MKKIILFISILYGTWANAQPGSLDNTFGTGGKVVTTFNSSYDDASALAIQGDGKIIAVGTGNDMDMARYNTDGSLDLSFGSGGKVNTTIGTMGCSASAVAIQTDGKILVAGSAAGDFALLRYNVNGSLDATFGANGIATTDFGNGENAVSIVIQGDGKIVTGGYTSTNTNSDFAIARYNSNGSLDNTFGTSGKVITSITSLDDVGMAVALQSDGKILQAGSSNDTYDGAIIRYNSNGTTDLTFGNAGIVTITSVQAYAISLQTDGKIVVSGATYNTASSEDFAILRFNSDGSADNSFGTGGKTVTAIRVNDDYATSLAIQSDGKLVAGGFAADTANSMFNDFCLVRYNSNGSLDNVFGNGGITTTDFGMSEIIHGIALQSDGKIVAAGVSDQPGSGSFALARYNVSNSVGIPAPDKNHEISIFPNPSQGSFTINVQNCQPGFQIILRDEMGNCVFEDCYQGGAKQEIKPKVASKGVYFVEIESGDSRIIRRVIIQ